MKNQINEDQISNILNDRDRMRKIIQSAIDDAMIKHKQAGNLVCGSKNGVVVWERPENIALNKRSTNS